MNNSIKPFIGLGGSTSYLSDRHPVTVIRIISDRKIEVQDANYKLISGSIQDGSAKFSYSENHEGAKSVFTLRKNGKWIRSGEGLKNGCRLSLTGWSYYYDPYF